MRKARKDIDRERLDLDSLEPVAMKSGSKEGRDDEEIEVIHIFSIDGEDYYAPTRIPFRVAMRSLDIAANQGEIAATAYQLRTVLGESAYQALMEFDDIEEDDFKRIAEAVNIIVMSSQEGKAR